ncbi:hypothetical protein Tco_0166123 [Tanacetum coccineum]
MNRWGGCFRVSVGKRIYLGFVWPDTISPPRHDDTSIPGTRLEPRSDKESPEVEIVQEKEEETTKDTDNIVIPVNVDDCYPKRFNPFSQHKLYQ